MFPFRRKFHLVIVCTANRTRSAYFSGYLKHYLKQRHPSGLKRIKITSAGTHAQTGGQSHDVVALIARKNGFSLRPHTAEPLSDRLVRRADLILVMEQQHKDFILENYPRAHEKVFRLMEYGGQGDMPVETLDVPDPTGKDVADFKAFIETAHTEADRLVHELLYREII